MKKITHKIVSSGLTLILGMTAGCEKPNTIDERAEEEYRKKSAKIASELQKNLGSRLKSAMREGGPVAGIRICKDVAGPVTEASSELFDDATVSRTALRVRNPENAPDSHSREVMQGWNQMIEQGESIPSADLHAEDHRMIVHRPIKMNTLCLTCHGQQNQMTPELKTAINEEYPDDRATGYENGDLRGAFRIVFER